MKVCLTQCEARNDDDKKRLLSRCFISMLCWTVWAFLSASPYKALAADTRLSEGYYQVDIPAQNLAKALNNLSEKTQQLLLFPYQVANKLDSNAVKGRYTLPQIMALMLDGTGFSGGLTQKGVLMISITESEDAQPNKNTHEDAMETKRNDLPRFMTSLFAALSAAGVGAANDTAQPAISQIEEVVVTAERRESTLQKTPIAINVFSYADIERSQILDTRDLASFSPSLTFNQALAGSQIYIRGVGQGNPITGSSPGVALHIDGVYLGHPYTNNASFYDAERFEVLRGPQGTLYGRNSTGGSINIITKSPTMEPELRATFGVGEYQRTWLNTAGNAVLIDDKLAVRGSLVVDRRDGYVENKITNQDVDDRDLKSYAASALYLPTDNVKVLLKADFQKDTRYEKPVSFLRSVAGSGIDATAFGALTSRNDKSYVYNNSDRQREDTFWGTNATITWQLGDLTVKSITGYRDSENIGTPGDNDGNSFAVLSIDSDNVSEEFSQEFSVAGTSGGGKLDWVAGVNYYDDEVTTVSLAILPFLSSLLPPLPPVTALDGSVVSLATLAASYNENLTSTGVFAQGNYWATEQLRLTAGVRYTADDKEKLQTVRSNVTAPSTQCESLSDDESWSAVTWKVGADYNVTDASMVYGSISTGFKAGGFNSGACDDDYDEEKITSYEVGFKSTLLDQRLQLNGALFLYDYTDLQVRAFQGAILEIANAGESEISGAELDFIFKPSANWAFNGGVAFLNAEYTKALLDNAMVPGTSLENVAGNRMERSPKLKYSVGAQYTLGSVDFRYELAYSDEMYVDSFESDFAKIGAHTEQNARVIWHPSSFTGLSVQAFVENFTNESYEDYLLPSSFVGGVAGAYGPPRTWGLLVNWDLL